jgi:hypothetical protein
MSRLIETDLFGEPVINGHKSVLARTFEYPPFSVLNARDGWWQERKRQWLALGIESELGRGDVIPGGGADPTLKLAGGAVCPPKRGLTWGNSPQITEKGLNFYRNREAAHD